jgi:hypothetical protein
MSLHALRIELVLPLASTLSNLWQRVYSLTVDAIKQFPSRYKVNVALTGFTSTHKLPTTLVVV